MQTEQCTARPSLRPSSCSAAPVQRAISRRQCTVASSTSEITALAPDPPSANRESTRIMAERPHDATPPRGRQQVPISDPRRPHHFYPRHSIHHDDPVQRHQMSLARALLETVAGLGRRTRLRSSPSVLMGHAAAHTKSAESKHAPHAGSLVTTLSMDLLDAREGINAHSEVERNGNAHEHRDDEDATAESGCIDHQMQVKEAEDDGDSEEPQQPPSAESIVRTLALLQQLQESAAQSESGETTVRKQELAQLVDGFAKALATTASRWNEHGVETEMQRLFVSHANVFDETVQNFIIQNFIQQTDYAKTFRSALRRTSLVRRCITAMYPTENLSTPAVVQTTSPAVRHHWRPSLAQRATDAAHELGLTACPDVTDPEIVLAVKQQLANISSWDFDLFTIAEALPGQTLVLVGNELLERYDLCAQFRTTKPRQHELLRQLQGKYHSHPYHNAEHAADVAQSLHHFLTLGGLGETVNPRSKCAAIIAAIVHDVGHTSFTNNFHISSNDDLAVQYVYRSPLEHMHCALAFQMMKSKKCDILQGLTRIEQMEIRTLITDMVLATDNGVHAAYLAKLEGLVCRSATSVDGNWKLFNPDDERLLLQMALHAADVSNPAKCIRYYKIWAGRILQEFYQQGDKERELELPVSIGYDRYNPIPVEKMQAGFILGFVRPLFEVICRLPSARLSHCLVHLEDNLAHWQSEINQKHTQS